MFYSQFTKRLNLTESEIKEQTRCYGHLIQETEDGVVLIDRERTEFGTLEEARQYIRFTKIKEDIEQEIQKELYEDIADTKIANIIKEHHDVKITDTLIESYKELASSKIFTTDPVALGIRKMNSLDRLIESKLDYVLNDGTKIAIDESTQTTINNILSTDTELIEYMRESKENFLEVLSQLEG